MPGKRNSKQKNNGSEGAKNGEEDKLAKLRQMEEERQRKWAEAWDKKLQDEDRLEDYKACVAPDEYFREPKIQSNVWVQVQHEKNAQHVQLTFQDVPVPKPKAPILPKLLWSEVEKKWACEEAMEKAAKAAEAAKTAKPGKKTKKGKKK